MIDVKNLGYVIVVFGGDSGCGMSHCPAHTVVREDGNLFVSSDEAKAYIARAIPEWQQPHVLMVEAARAPVPV
jgi:hypothetical protein